MVVRFDGGWLGFFGRSVGVFGGDVLWIQWLVWMGPIQGAPLGGAALDGMVCWRWQVTSVVGS